MKWFVRLAEWCLVLTLLTAYGAQAVEERRLYDYMVYANKAQVIMLEEEGLMSRELASALAEALIAVMEEEEPPGLGYEWHPAYLELEGWLVDRVGEGASNIHLGRSRNDLGAAWIRMKLREWILSLSEDLVDVRAVVQQLAGEHQQTVMPGFTHAVQAQPSTVGHFLLAFDAGLARDCERLRELYARINRSPLGSAAFNTSGFPLNRERLAGLLGFDGLVENSYDAIVVSTADSKVEFANLLSLSALNIGRLAQYIAVQYDAAVPGIVLRSDALTPSSIMPQKRNPSSLERLRIEASDVVGLAMTSTMIVHNTPLYEVKDVRQDHFMRLWRLAEASFTMYGGLQEVLEALVFNEEVLKALVDEDFSTMTEFADTLWREAGVPFRIGHEVASKLTDYGREHGIPPSRLSFEEVANIYFEVTGESLTLSEEVVSRAFDSWAFIEGRRGTGGPQPESMERMLSGHAQELAGFRSWIRDEDARIADALRVSDDVLAKLAGF